MIGKIERVNLRDVWKHEAFNFTAWLEENIDVLNDALDLSLENVDRERSAGNFNVDLVAEDGSGNMVIIENQLERSNHDHLGKVLTYLTSLEAKMAIWIVKEPRPEHVRAIAWLNESGSAAFYLVKVEAIKIGKSPAAPLLTLITGPSEEAKKVGDTKKELAERHKARFRFWTALLECAKAKTKLHANIAPGHYNWICTTAGLPPGVNLNYVVRQKDAQVELYIDAGRDRKEQNKEIFETLRSGQKEIESEFGGKLIWEALPTKRACRISYVVEIAGWRNEERWAEAHEAMVDAMIRLERALKPHLKHIKRTKAKPLLST